MPGMFTCHFHATYHELGSQPNVPYGNEYPPAYHGAAVADRTCDTALRAGLHGRRSAPASAHDVEPGVDAGDRRRAGPGPALRARRSRELSTTGHSNDGVPWYWDMPGTGAVRFCDGPEDVPARRA